MRTRCRLGLKRRFVATIEWLRWLPKPGFFPQIAQILDIAAAQSSCEHSVARDRARLPRCGGSQVGERVGHLERGSHRLRALLDPGVRLLDAVEREHSERNRDTRLECRELETARALAGDV